MSRRVFELLRARCGTRTDGWVFPSKRSASGHLCSIDRLFRQARQRAGLPKELVLYCARHDYGTRVLMRTGNLAAVMRAMGHRDVKAAMHYQHQVLDYVGRNTHRVAISNNRLLDIEGGQVYFRYKDYRHDTQQKTMTLSADEFIRRFLLHALPDGFHRIRYYGLLGNRHRKEKLEQCRKLLGMVAPAESTST